MRAWWVALGLAAAMTGKASAQVLVRVGDPSRATYSELHSFYLLVDRPSVYGLPDNPFNPWLRMKGDYLRAAVCALAAIALLLPLLLAR